MDGKIEVKLWVNSLYEKQLNSLGMWRSTGQLGRAIGPIVGCMLYWWLSPYVWCLIGGCGALVVFVFAALTSFPPSIKAKKE